MYRSVWAVVAIALVTVAGAAWASSLSPESVLGQTKTSSGANWSGAMTGTGSSFGGDVGVLPEECDAVQAENGRRAGFKAETQTGETPSPFRPPDSVEPTVQISQTNGAQREMRLVTQLVRGLRQP